MNKDALFFEEGQYDEEAYGECQVCVVKFIVEPPALGLLIHSRGWFSLYLWLMNTIIQTKESM